MVLELTQTDLRREMQHLSTLPLSQREIADSLGVSQPALSKALKRAENVKSVPEGFSGASPYEICQRYAVGQLGREQVIDELTRWPYTPIPAGDGYELIVHPPGTVEEVVHAFYNGLIDKSIYEEIYNALS